MTNRLMPYVALLMLTGTGAAQAQTSSNIAVRPPTHETKWVVDMVHSQVDFGVRHLVGSVRGTFGKWYALLSTEENGWQVGNVNVSIETASLNTGNGYRDADLRSDRFFAVKRFPQMTFQGTGFASSDSTLDLRGLLTIRDRAKPITLHGQFRGIAKDKEGHQRIAFEARGTVDRRDFGMNWNESIGGTQLVGNDVEITIGIEAVRVD
jgi:polyisoprenoid-binding protein YceI